MKYTWPAILVRLVAKLSAIKPGAIISLEEDEFEEMEEALILEPWGIEEESEEES